MIIKRTITIAALAAAAWSIAAPAGAKDTITGPVACALTRVTDGDTFRCIATPWPDLRVDISVRPDGFDAPELRGKCEAEKDAAARAKDQLTRLLAAGAITLHNVRLGKYAGRVAADVHVDATPIAGAMIESGNARPYTGGGRYTWCGQ